MKSMILQWLFSLLRDNKELIIRFLVEQGYEIFNKDVSDSKEIDTLKSDIGNLRSTNKGNHKFAARLDSTVGTLVTRTNEYYGKINALAALVECELNKTNDKVGAARDLIDGIVDDADNTKTTLGERIGDLNNKLVDIDKDLNVVKNTYSKKRVKKAKEESK
ncbi:MAG: hypothetical protein KAS32_14410 [Candidatus Peribacteraceae bacterium]|nr:hypothetical protein [Candidatus Peribacteraceae bacterium]